MKNYIYILVILLVIISLPVAAQDYTSHHDAMKMNQFTVMEQGIGGLTPAFYYQLFHSTYSSTAAEANKTVFRSLADAFLIEQKDYAESIDSHLVWRNTVEMLNIADRSADIAWATEGGKITTMLERFRSNINYLMFAGGSYDDYTRWLEIYNMFNCAIQSIKEAYMPNAERKGQYLRLYEEIAHQNEVLLSVIIFYSQWSQTKDLLSVSGEIDKVTSSGKERLATIAFGRWKVAWDNQINDEGGLLIDGSSSADSDASDKIKITPLY